MRVTGAKKFCSSHAKSIRFVAIEPTKWEVAPGGGGLGAPTSLGVASPFFPTILMNQASAWAILMVFRKERQKKTDPCPNPAPRGGRSLLPLALSRPRSGTWSRAGMCPAGNSSTPAYLGGHGSSHSSTDLFPLLIRGGVLLLGGRD